MVNHTWQTNLLHELQELVQADRRAFKQERPFWRAAGLVLGEVFNFGGHTVTQGLLTLGMSEGDWSSWYRLFSRERFDEETLSHCLLEETLKQVPEAEPYGVALDSTVLHRSSLKMPGTSWLRDSRFSAFRPGIHRGQRFVHGAWLTPLEEGYRRAIPLRFLPAFPPKGVPASVRVRTEWETGGLILQWLRDSSDQVGRKEQKILVLADGGFDVLELWRRVPAGVILLTRTARNRCLYDLPKQSPILDRDVPPRMESELPIPKIGCMPGCATGRASLWRCEAKPSPCVTRSWVRSCGKDCPNDRCS